MTTHLGMYPFGCVESAWQELASHIEEATRGLCEQAVLTHVCGLDFAMHPQRDRYVVTPSFSVPGCGEGHYSSVIVATSPDPLRNPGDHHAVVNDWDSFSGSWAFARWVAQHHVDMSHFWGVRVSGSHAASLEALISGDAQIASLDALSWHFLGREHPGVENELFVVGWTAKAPAPPLVLQGGSREEAATVAEAIATAALPPSAGDELRLEGWRQLGASVYEDFFARPVTVS